MLKIGRYVRARLERKDGLIPIIDVPHFDVISCTPIIVSIGGVVLSSGESEMMGQCIKDGLYEPDETDQVKQIMEKYDTV